MIYPFDIGTTNFDYYRYPLFPFGEENSEEGSINSLDLFHEIFTCDNTINPLFDYINGSDWLTNNFGSTKQINVFRNYFLNNYRNYKMNYRQYISNKYLYHNKYYEYTLYYSKWWELMYNHMGFDIVNLLNNNSIKYKRMYELFMTEYNPLWNVDGNEVRTITHEGEADNSSSELQSGSNTLVTSFQDFLKTNERELTDSLEKVGSESDVETLDTAVNFVGSFDHTKTGYDEIQNSTTTFNSSSDYDTTKSHNTYNTTDSDTYDGRRDTNTGTDTHEYTFDNRADNRTLSEYNTEGYSGTKADTNTSSNSLTSNSSKSDSYENVENLKRQGNIGITSSQNLYNQELDLLPRIALYTELAHDIASEFLILNEGV